MRVEGCLGGLSPFGFRGAYMFFFAELGVGNQRFLGFLLAGSWDFNTFWGLVETTIRRLNVKLLGAVQKSVKVLRLWVAHQSPVP